MNPITPWLVCFALFLMLVFAVYAAIKTLQKKTQEIKHLEGEVQKQKENMAYLVKHAEEIAEIEKDQDKVQEEIQNAKSDEEVADIINAIININNSKLRQ
jgi:septal ring factor EnvC (AmiA/AmiB activator)